MLFIKQGRRADAIARLEEALRLQPNHAQAYNNLGLMLNESGRPAEAAVMLAQAVRLRPLFAEAHNNLGVAYAALGRTELAEASYLPKEPATSTGPFRDVFSYGRVSTSWVGGPSVIVGRGQVRWASSASGGVQSGSSGRTGAVGVAARLGSGPAIFCSGIRGRRRGARTVYSDPANEGN